ncbi:MULTISPECIES: winged helix-turn-helix domain-containing protein [unclassified Clostridioides]|uniref:winged helix-turn-helix domain-containing protein n=1 Tax=unclassified Clostridioides TaxID=2635829 RepID=UPI001D11ACDF|nr:response regulator transcription factor [Clostridioides sp. ZZV14-6150]MCC0659997.1 response regulator transcription factor [Clostridioides sp. ZZV14-6154]MCC0667186.1 response regulator transcription factor [Clostridioides sp. ZZV14-6153]MCC0717319.1 response regulator transcription factor [Clostridioides sp. ZZV14-6105]MCC0721205.1 response regulator transcription factor [Clostridioides sp. ZZV14-6104]MCC0727530.1 response regulator transcription factor [Clostridioides sp. ZZV14-6045]MCC
MNTKVLVIDDEMHIVELLKFNLEVSNYEVSYSYDGFDGFIKAKEVKPDLILLDWMLPNISGIDVLRKIRSDKDLKNIPVIMLTAKNMENDKVEGLEVGADDYITKPFSIKELLARVSSVLRRYNLTSTGEENNILTTGNLKLDLSKHEVTKGSEKIELTLKEFELLKLLIQNKGKVLSRNYLLDKIWGYEYYGETRTVDVHIRYLRKKIEDEDEDKSEKYIETIRGVGYKID